MHGCSYIATAHPSAPAGHPWVAAGFVAVQVAAGLQGLGSGRERASPPQGAAQMAVVTSEAQQFLGHHAHESPALAFIPPVFTRAVAAMVATAWGGGTEVSVRLARGSLPLLIHALQHRTGAWVKAFARDLREP
jgi:hypothetical protein